MKTRLKGFFFLWAIFALMSASLPASADDNAPAGRITFYKDVLPILQENCQTCHRPGGANNAGMVAPMAFMDYREVRPWAKAIANQVRARTMPPWHTSAEFHGVFSNERVMTDSEVDTILKWVATGASAGNPGDAPEPLVWDSSGGWAIATPDLIVRMPEPYFVADDVQDQYITFRVVIGEEQLGEARYIKESQIIPGSEAVHHIIARPLGGFAPGNGPTVTPKGVEDLLRPNTEVNFNMHYHKESGPGTGVWDDSHIGVVFFPEGADLEIKYRPGGPRNIANSGFEIPPNHPGWAVGAAHTYTEDMLLSRFMPHMHLRGKSITYTAFYPDGTEEILLDIPRYDFNWQNDYIYKEEKWLPAGTRVEVLAHFDNSSDNPYNPDPTLPVSYGGPTTDEMMIGWLSTYLPIDQADSARN
ncbi:hypothetical protein IIC65_00385 [Candidatus Sumerlaeota bacterium]|nr:hypothetical protein [Candidatus Sumerlaeota bacterium]